MVRVTHLVLAGALLALAGLVVGVAAKPPDAEKPKAETPSIAGSWKMSIPAIAGGRPLWLLKLEEKDGKWAADVSSADRVPAVAIEKIVVGADTLTFNLKLMEEEKALFMYEIKIPKVAGDKLLGTVLLPNKELEQAQLEKTNFKRLDAFDLNKEILAKTPDRFEAVMAGLDLLKAAKAKKAKKDEVTAWAEKTAATAEKFGPRYYVFAVKRVAELLGSEEDFADLGVEYSRKYEKLLTAKDKPLVRRQALEMLANALENAGKKDEAKEITEKAKKIDTSFKPEPFAGRKAKSDRVVLVELFTGAHCPPCVAADLAFDAVGHAYKPSDVILLEYHEHIPRPDPLTNPDTEARMKFYDQAVTGTPTILFNGKSGNLDGGGKDEAGDKYDEYTGLIDPLLELPADLKLKATATQKGAKIEIKAEVSDVAKPSDDLRLRLVLIEDKVEYAGTNKITEHHHVVRALPGGADGVAIKGKAGKQTATVDLDELKKHLKDYLDKYAKDHPNKPFPVEGQPMELKKLKAVAFVQDDGTGEVLQAVQVEIKAE